MSTRLRLHTLGPVTVRGDGDPAASSRVTQPRHLALLCYLALARPRGLHARDTLAALLWPDDDQIHGRRALRNALYTLRRQLGGDAIISAGDHLIGVDTARLSCDAIDLERGSLDDPDILTPVAEPLHGLHVAGAAEFDHWMSSERARIRALVDRYRSSPIAAIVRGPETGRSRSSAAVMCARGDYLFLRNIHGGPAEELMRSREYFERAHELDPTYAPALAGLSNFYAVAARRGVLTPFHETFARAIALSEQTLELDPNLATPRVHFGVKAMYLDDDWERAGQEFAAAAKAEPGYAEARRFWGVWLGQMGRHDEALREMEAAASLEPDMPQITSSLAATQLAAGRRTDAEATMRRTLSLVPLHAPSRERLLRLLEEDERFEEALAERCRTPATANAEAFRAAFGAQGASGYQRHLDATLREEAAALEARILEGAPLAVNDIFLPRIVRLVGLYARLGEWKRAKTWRMQGIAERPALKHWLAPISEGQTR